MAADEAKAADLTNLGVLPPLSTLLCPVIIRPPDATPFSPATKESSENYAAYHVGHHRVPWLIKQYQARFRSGADLECAPFPGDFEPAADLDDDSDIHAMWWGLDAPTKLTRQLIALGNADGSGGWFVLWVHGARQGRPAATPDTAPVVLMDSEGEGSRVVAHSLAGFVAWQCAGGDMDALGSRRDGEEEEEEQQQARESFAEWVRGLGINPITDPKLAEEYADWSTTVCPSFEQFMVDVAASEPSAKPDDIMWRAVDSGYEYWGKLLELLESESVDINSATRRFGAASLLSAATNIEHARTAEEGVRLLLGLGAKANAHSGQWNRTALHFAAERGHDSVVRMLLDAGANADAVASTGLTPYMLASIRGHTKTMRTLAVLGANVLAKESKGLTAAELVAKNASRALNPPSPEVVALALELQTAAEKSS